VSQAGDFKSKYGPWALVTGGSSGIGEEYARRFAELGLDVVIVARGKERLERVKGDLEKRYAVSVRALSADLRDPESIAEIEKATSDIEIGMLVSNAGYDNAGALLINDLAEENRYINLNVYAPLNLAYVFGKKMTGRGRGGIIFTSSVFGYQGVPYGACYAASKAFVRTLGEALFIEYGDKGVDVLVVSPGHIHTGAQKNMADEGWVDYSKLPRMMNVWMTPAQVVEKALTSLGRKPVVIPGVYYRVLTLSGWYLARRKDLVKIYARVMKKMLAPHLTRY